MKSRSIGGTVFDSANLIFLLFILLITLYPLWYILIISVSDLTKSSLSELYVLPHLLTLGGYSVVLHNPALLQGYLVSGSRVACGVLTGLLCNGMLAYVLSRNYFVWRKWMNVLVVLTMFISSGVIPFFLVVHSLHLTNTFLALFLPFVFDPFGIILIKNYFRTIPESLDECAKIDGANDLVIFFRIYIPLSMPIIATMSLFWAVFYWNDFIWGSFLVADVKLLPIGTVLYKIIVESSNLASLNAKRTSVVINVESIKAAAIMLTTLPVLFVYPFLQKYFVKGVVLGAVKE